MIPPWMVCVFVFANMREDEEEVYLEPNPKAGSSRWASGPRRRKKKTRKKTKRRSETKAVNLLYQRLNTGYFLEKPQLSRMCGEKYKLALHLSQQGLSAEAGLTCQQPASLKSKWTYSSKPVRKEQRALEKHCGELVLRILIGRSFHSSVSAADSCFQWRRQQVKDCIIHSHCVATKAQSCTCTWGAWLETLK